jgi:hypothetical protein
MTLSKEHQKKTLTALIAVLILLNGYHYFTREEPKTAPLAYPRGAVSSSPVRHGLQAQAGGADPLSIFLERQGRSYPGVSRDIFRMERPAARPMTRPVATIVVAPLPPAPPERSPEEIAADLARADLAKFRYLGYLTEKDNTLFLSKDGELFIVKIGDKVLNTYTVKEANKDAVVLLDTVTRVERRVELAGDGTQQTPQQQRPPQPAPPRPQQIEQPKPQQLQPPMRPPMQPPAEQPAHQPFQQRRFRDLRPQDKPATN